VLRAEALATALRERHCITADAHELASDALVSVHRGLVVYSNGADFSWRSPEPRRGRPLQAVAVGVSTAARRVAEHHQALVDRRLAELLNNPALLADSAASRTIREPRAQAAPKTAPREEPAVTSHPHDQPDVTEWKPGAVTVLQHLRAAFHTHMIYPSIAYDEGEPRLVISLDMTVWANADGTVICWGPAHMEEPAEQASASDLEGIARRIVEQLVERESAMTTH
jgi:hypothetical protein